MEKINSQSKNDEVENPAGIKTSAFRFHLPSSDRTPQGNEKYARCFLEIVDCAENPALRGQKFYAPAQPTFTQAIDIRGSSRFAANHHKGYDRAASATPSNPFDEIANSLRVRQIG